jgi:hypothetical protein
MLTAAAEHVPNGVSHLSIDHDGMAPEECQGLDGRQELDVHQRMVHCNTGMQNHPVTPPIEEEGKVF